MNKNTEDHKEVEPIPADFGQKADDTLIWLPLSFRPQIELGNYRYSKLR